mmetsp:Transcript_17811/g.44987  ORF Transcript_17811/g.44987 Transcript_17811/m.44987 type:complete len:290 (+) Transcript_17811:92-961(+)
MPRDPYQVLNLSKDAGSSEIQKAYKKLALKWHPDKNPDNQERAEKMFKEVQEAYELLKDPQKKSDYDRFGFAPEGGGPSMNQFRGFRQHPGSRGGMDPEMDPLFQAFFGNGFAFAGGPGVHFRTFNMGGHGGRPRGRPQQQQQQQHHRQEDQSGFAQLLQLFPLLLLFLFTFFNFGGESGGNALYTLSRDATHPVRRTTDGRGVHYFVKGGFEREIQMRYGSAWLGELETKIENDKLSDLRVKCEADTKERTRRARGAQLEGDASSLRHVLKNDSASCAELYKVFPELH